VPYNRLAQLGGDRVIEVRTREALLERANSVAPANVREGYLFIGNQPWMLKDNFWLIGDVSRRVQGTYNADNLVVSSQDTDFGGIEFFGFGVTEPLSGEDIWGFIQKSTVRRLQGGYQVLQVRVSDNWATVLGPAGITVLGVPALTVYWAPVDEQTYTQATAFDAEGSYTLTTPVPGLSLFYELVEEPAFVVAGSNFDTVQYARIQCARDERIANFQNCTLDDGTRYLIQSIRPLGFKSYELALTTEVTE